MKIILIPARADDLCLPMPALRRSLEHGFKSEAQGLEILRDVLGTLTKPPRPIRWGTFWARDGRSGMFAGLCGFKNPPGDAGWVEIAYFTFPRLEGRGVACAMAGLLLDQARQNGVTDIRAHTLPVRNASGSVLERNGFFLQGRAIDPEDGEVWAWRYLKP